MSVTLGLVLLGLVILVRFGPSLILPPKKDYDATVGLTKPDDPEQYAANFSEGSRRFVILVMKMLAVAIPVSFIIEYLILP